MATQVGSLLINLALESGAFKSGLDATQKQLKTATRQIEAAGKSLQQLGQNLTLGLSAPLTAFGGFAVKAASDAAELQSAFNQTFGQMQGAMNAWAEATGNAMGRSTQEMQRGANAFGMFFNQAAPTKQAAAELSQTFAVLAQDLSSFFNVDPTTALEKLRSGLSGESEPLRDFGVFMTEAAVKAKAMEMGLASAGGELTEQAKIMARAKLILEGTTQAQGDVARTSDSLANRTRATQAAFDELKVSVGDKLQPVMLALLGVADKVLGAFNNLSPGAQTAIVAIGGVAVAAGPLLIGLGSIVSALAPLSGALTAASTGGLSVFKASVLALTATLSPWAIAIGACGAALVAMNYAMEASDSSARNAERAVAEFGVSVADADAYLDRLNAQTNSGKNAQHGYAGAVDQAKVKMKAAAEEANRLIDQLYGVEAAAFRAAKALATQRAVDSYRKIKELKDEQDRIRQSGWQWGPGGLNEGRSLLILERQLTDERKRQVEAGKQLIALDRDFNSRRASANQAGGAANSIGRLNQGLRETGSAARAGAGEVRQAFKTISDSAGEALRQLQLDTQILMVGLFPDAREIAEFRKQLTLLDRGIAAGGVGGFSVEQLQAGRGRLIESAGSDVLRNTPLPLADQLARFGAVPLGDTQSIKAALESLSFAANDNADKMGVSTVRIAESFKDMADKTLNALSQMANAIKGGGFLDILGAVINLGMQLGSIGIFGKGVQGRINAPKVPGYANGTNYAPGGLALVGERGPELVRLPRGSQVIPNHALRGNGGGNTYHFQGNMMTPEFWQRIQAGDMQAAMAGAKGGEARVFARQRRQVG